MNILQVMHNIVVDAYNKIDMFGRSFKYSQDVIEDLEEQYNEYRKIYMDMEDCINTVIELREKGKIKF